MYYRASRLSGVGMVKMELLDATISDGRFW